MDDLRRRRAAARARAAGLPACRGALPVRRARRGRAGAVRPDGRAVPDPVLAHVPAPRRAALARLEASGGVERWTRAADADPSSRGEPRARRTPSSASSGPSCRAGSAARPGTGSLKCLHAHAAFALARPGYAARRPDPRRGGAALARGRLLRRSMIGPSMDLELARHQWAEGRRALERARATTADGIAVCSRQVEVVLAELTPSGRADLHAGRARRGLRPCRPLDARGDRRRLRLRPCPGLGRPRRRGLRPLLAPRLRLRPVSVARPRALRAAAGAACSAGSCSASWSRSSFLGGIGLGEALHDNPSRAAPRPCSGRSRSARSFPSPSTR